jgi:uncharacterized protein (TIGR03067 family)
MNDVKLAHPEIELLTAFALGRLGEAELVQVHSHLSECSECRQKVETAGDDTLVALLRAADTTPDAVPQNSTTGADTIAVTPKAPPPPGLAAELAQHGRYRVQELLGVGGMGAVYKAQHLLMERTVALKLVSPSLTSNSAMVERFQREVKTAGKLKHPNIVMAYDAEQAGDAHFLVMEYVEGKSLARVVAEQGPSPVRDACEYIRQAAVGLQYAHERGMVHRDIKPQNLMLTPDGQVKILDFGLARFAMEAEPPLAELPARASLTQLGAVMGTPDYIAPEQARDAHTADIRADIYSLGCTLYDLLAGHAPFTEGTIIAKIAAHLERMPQPLGELRSDIPPQLARVVERMMAKDPAERHQTPAAVAEALAPFVGNATTTSPKLLILRPWLWVAAALLAILPMATAGIIILQTSRGDMTFKIDDPDIELVVRNNGDLVVIRDTKTGQSWNVDTQNLNLVRADNPDGLRIALTGREPLVLRRRDGKLMTITGPAANAAKGDKSKARNPFGVADVEDPDGAEVQAYASKVKSPPGSADDPNAQQWVTQPTKGDPGSLDGDWYGRWKHTGEKEWQYCKRTVQIKTVGDRVYILYSDHQGQFLADTRREKNRLIGRVQRLDLPEDNDPCIFAIVGPDRLDGDFGGKGRQDFRRKLEQRDAELIQGTWHGVSAKLNGEAVPQEVLKVLNPSITFAGTKVVWKANPTESGKPILSGALSKLSFEGVFHLDPAKTPKTIDLMVLGQAPKKSLLGIYRLAGDALEICCAVDPDHAADRPREFDSQFGKFIAQIFLKRERSER